MKKNIKYVCQDCGKEVNTLSFGEGPAYDNHLCVQCYSQRVLEKSGKKMDKPEWILTSIEIMQLQEYREGDNENIGYERNISNYAQKKLLEYQLAKTKVMKVSTVQTELGLWIESMIEQLGEK